MEFLDRDEVIFGVVCGGAGDTMPIVRPATAHERWAVNNWTMNRELTAGGDGFEEEDEMFVTSLPASQGCIACGKNIEEAFCNAVEAIAGCLHGAETSRDTGTS